MSECEEGGDGEGGRTVQTDDLGGVDHREGDGGRIEQADECCTCIKRAPRNVLGDMWPEFTGEVGMICALDLRGASHNFPLLTRRPDYNHQARDLKWTLKGTARSMLFCLTLFVTST